MGAGKPTAVLNRGGGYRIRARARQRAWHTDGERLKDLGRNMTDISISKRHQIEQQERARPDGTAVVPSVSRHWFTKDLHGIFVGNWVLT